MYLAKAYAELLPSLVTVDDAYKQHFIAAYNLRAQQLDHPLSRLALFLNPCFKAAACGDGQGFAKMVELVSHCHVTASFCLQKLLTITAKYCFT